MFRLFLFRMNLNIIFNGAVQNLHLSTAPAVAAALPTAETATAERHPPAETATAARHPPRHRKAPKRKYI